MVGMALPEVLVHDLQSAGYYPQLTQGILADSLYDEPVLAHFVHIDTHVDIESIHRHVTAFVLTETRLLLAHVDSTSMTVVGVTAGALACLPFAPALVREMSAAPPGTVLGVVYLGVFPTALAFLLWGFALTHTGAGLLSSSSLLVPALTLVLSWLLLGEVPPLLAALGGALCLAGAGFAIAPAVLSSLRTRHRADYPDAVTVPPGTEARPGEEPAHVPCS